MPRKPPPPEVWRSRRYRGGIFNRAGWCWFRFSGRNHAPGIPFAPEYKADVITLYEAWVRSLKNPQPVAPAAVQRIDAPDLFSAVNQFERERFSGMTLATQKLYSRATSYYLRHHLPIDYTALKDDLVERNNQAASDTHPDRLAQNTRRKYLDYLWLFYEWVIEKGWLTENPVRAVGKPKKKKKADVFVYTRDEIALICEDLRSQPGQEDVALLVELLSLAGLRISEALGLRWMDILPNGLRILNAKGARPRTISLKMIPGLSDVLKRLKKLMDHYDKHPPGGRRRRSPPENIFWWTDATKPRTFFNESKARLGLDWGGRVLHTLRGSAEYWWEFTLGMEERTICDIAGHSSGTRNEYYRVTPTTEDLEDKDRHRRQREADAVKRTR